MTMERHELHGVKVYQLNICEAVGDHHLCPGITTLSAGDFELGTVACKVVSTIFRTFSLRCEFGRLLG